MPTPKRKPPTTLAILRHLKACAIVRNDFTGLTPEKAWQQADLASRVWVCRTLKLIPESVCGRGCTICPPLPPKRLPSFDRVLKACQQSMARSRRARAR